MQCLKQALQKLHDKGIQDTLSQKLYIKDKLVCTNLKAYKVPNSCHSYSVYVHLIIAVIARKALYYTDFSLPWKELFRPVWS